MTELILPDSNLEMPELYDITRKPTGNIKINPNSEIGSFIERSKNLVVGPFGNCLDFKGLNYTAMSSLDNSAITGSGLITDGVYYNQNDFSFNNTTKLSIVQIVDFSIDGGLFHSDGVECTFLREAEVDGVSISGRNGTTNLRTLIKTTGTSIWTGLQDIDIASYKNKKVIIAITWDGSNRYVHIGTIGSNITLLRYDPCTGVCVTGNTDIIIGGGNNIKNAGPFNPILLTILSHRYIPMYLLNNLCMNPYKFLVPV